jgi:DNA-directed RNA polymerase specialized sigma24 family protein
MPVVPGHYAAGPEALVVSLASKGDRDAFAELVRRRQSWIRNLMRRCCGEENLADDLSQQVLLQAWRKIRQLKEADKFGSWLKQLAINEWLQYRRKHDVLRGATVVSPINSIAGLIGMLLLGLQFLYRRMVR